MPINVKCEQCGRTMTVPEQLAGMTGKCVCGARIKIPKDYDITLADFDLRSAQEAEKAKKTVEDKSASTVKREKIQQSRDAVWQLKQGGVPPEEDDFIEEGPTQIIPGHGPEGPYPEPDPPAKMSRPGPVQVEQEEKSEDDEAQVPEELVSVSPFAYVIDVLLVLLVSHLLTYLVGVGSGAIGADEVISGVYAEEVRIIYLLTLPVLLVLYFWAFKGKTVGTLLVGKSRS